MRKLAIVAGIVAMVAVPAAASIPPVGWKGPQWTGPGQLCGSGFTLMLAEGETAEQQYPSVGLIRFLVRSDSGIFEVAEDWYRRPFEGRELVDKRAEGNVSRVTESGWNRTYVFQSESSTMPILVSFDPLMHHEPSFVGREAERSVLDRVAFGRSDGPCLDPVKTRAGEAG